MWQQNVFQRDFTFCLIPRPEDPHAVDNRTAVTTQLYGVNRFIVTVQDSKCLALSREGTQENGYLVTLLQS